MRKGEKKGSQGIQIGVITDKGRLVTSDILKKFEIDASSTQLDDLKWKAPVIEPPHDLVKLMSWIDVSVIHSSCVRQKQMDSVGIGYDFKYNLDLVKEGEQEPKKETDNQYMSLKAFFRFVNKTEDIVSLLKKVFLDYEGCGNGYIEVSRGSDNKINGMFHINATTVRWMKDKARLVQQSQGQYVYFKLFGDERILNKKTGNFVKTLVDPDQLANEIIPITQYTWKSSIYGLPEWLPALFAMFGNKKEKEYNIDFFLNYGMPAYAVLFQGGTLGTEEKEALVKYFETEMRGSCHKVLTLGTPKGVTIKFERLSVEEKEASFKMYRKDNRDEILTAHHVPPYRVGIVEEGKLGGTVAEDTDRIYLDSVINPRQEQFSWIINELIIKRGFDVGAWEFYFKDVNIKDAKSASEVHDKYFNMGVKTSNQIGKDLGHDPYVGGDIYYVKSGMVPVGVSVEGKESGRVVDEEVAVVEEEVETEQE